MKFTLVVQDSNCLWKIMVLLSAIETIGDRGVQLLLSPIQS